MEITAFVLILLAASISLPLTQQVKTVEKNATARYIASVVIKIKDNIYFTERRCLSTIVAKNIVVTAKKCVGDFKPEEMYVYPNLINQRAKCIEAPLRVKKVEKHWNSELAILVLSHPIKNKVFRLAKLPQKSVRNGTKVVAQGYKLLGDRSDHLLQTSLTIVNCQKRGILCAKSQYRDRVICPGYGAPILLTRNNKGWIFVGMLYYQENASTCRYSSKPWGKILITDIAQHKEWIKRIMKQNKI